MLWLLVISYLFSYLSRRFSDGECQKDVDYIGEIDMSLIIKRPVILKTIVTEEFKEQLTKNLSNTIKQIDIRIDQMNFREKKIIANDRQQIRQETALMREKLRQEKIRQEQIRDELQRKLDEIPSLEVGSEFISGTYDAPVKIEVGDNIMEKLSQAEIIIKDGVIINIIQ